MLSSLDVAVGVFIVGLLTLAVRAYFDARDAWWKRVQWAIDKTQDPETRSVGLAALTRLTASRALLRQADQALLNAVVDRLGQ